MTVHPIVEALRELLPSNALVTDPDLLANYRHDSAALCESHLPLAVTLPDDESAITQIMKLSLEHRVPVVPQGALTGLSGAANAVQDCIVVNTRRMNRILHIDAANHTAVVQPGVTNRELRLAAAEFGLTYRPDPSSWESSTIGGNIATNAGGLCCVKYGVTQRFVRGLRVILPDGRSTSLGRRTVKGVAGLNLTELFIGSEGTLGIITEATVGLDPQGAPGLTMAASFADATAAGRAVTAVRKAGITPSLLELIDRTVLRAVDSFARMGIDHTAGALLIAQSDAGSAAPTELAAIADLCSDAGGFDVVVADDEQEAEQLIAARRLAYPALESLGSPLIDDVCVPISALAEMIDFTEQVADESGLVIGVVGHAGDGNLHPTVVVDPGDPGSVEAAHHAIDRIAERALELGGTITGEHGVGLLKVGLLERELDPVAAQLQRQIKELLDPHYLLNPGKVLTRGAVSEWSKVQGQKDNQRQ
ncbi:FAD-binding oxidoreductase [Rhodococcus sp. ACPA1]|uniref:FAD-binding oxidoreductase n=1 Tax=Rhodococcus sp. ACPA1 TaxID=2028572 RepID=UPI000BB15F10|nr:FAD-linked oxidase C-terminal domain-containing protein [Rhodococcus sp. ACPA1]PBC47450.1 FAD-binding oxidoreductase [Rhodococcus sp. ACPA1]